MRRTRTDAWTYVWVDMFSRKSAKIDIEQLLPYKSKFLMIDRVVLYEPNRKIVTQKHITGAEWYITDHYPQDPMMPGHITAEVMVQTCALLFRAIYEKRKDATVYLTSSRTRFFSVVRPEDRIITTAQPIRVTTGAAIFRAEARVRGELAARGQFTLAFSTSGDKDAEKNAALHISEISKVRSSSPSTLAHCRPC
ncbi:MAG: beta-hydroxyacyl-ACP dehydratase [Phycisphaerales bacterium]|nr:MAG: beta-hydroxyacyl-ACP dehydratase [Phycisphaerales bacterium]